MNKHVKQTIGTFLFAIGLVALVNIASYISMPKNNIAESGMEEVEANGVLGEPSNTIDTLFLGDSESYCSFIPLQIWKETGYTSYVCGTSGQTLDYTNAMLKRVFEKQTPKIVFLETNAIYRQQVTKNYMFTMLCEKYSIFRYHDRWKKLEWDDLTKKVEFTWTDDNKGYRYNMNMDPSKHIDYMKMTEEKAEISSLNRTCVEEIKKLCDEHGAKLVFVSTPSTKNWNYERHNGIVEFASELGCEYIDMNTMQAEIPIDWNTDTRDKGDHLNYLGAKKATAFMSNYLNETGLLYSHKEDEEYQKWDELLARFERVIS